MSVNHQYIQFSDQVIKRYKKATVGLLTGTRLNPHRPENQEDWLLQTPESNFMFVQDPDTGKTRLVRTKETYEDEVIELYSPLEVKLFERLNKRAIESGALIEYNEDAPDLDTTNVLSESDIARIAGTKQLLSLKKQLQSISSVYTMQRIVKAAEELDRPNSIMNAVKERLNELSGNDKG